MCEDCELCEKCKRKKYKKIKNVKQYLQFLYDRGDLDLLSLDQSWEGADTTINVIHNTWPKVQDEPELNKIRLKLIKKLKKWNGIE